ncbi:MAG TPA: M50 family metallopeptidase [Candidatus Dormibacteraeota bacterium]
MNFLQLLIGAVAIVGMFLLLVGPHEFGHFAVAKLFKVGVYEFSLGLGKRLWSITRNGTLYSIAAIPFGGFVRLAGMEPGDYDAPSSFHFKPAYQRLLILFAGPLVNFLVAALVWTGVGFTQLNSEPGKVMAVAKNGQAYGQGIRPGDAIQAVNGHPLARPDDIRKVEDANPGQPLVMTVRHAGGATFTTTITPVFNQQENRYLIGISTAGIFTPWNAVETGALFPFAATKVLVQSMAQLVTGQVPGGFFGQQGATGAIGFGYFTYEAAAQGLASWLTLVAFLSMALGLTNLLPLPALDGGRMVVVLLEKLRGRPFDRKREEAVQRAGLVALLALMALIAFFDVQRIATGQFPGIR